MATPIFTLANGQPTLSPKTLARQPSVAYRSRPSEAAATTTNTEDTTPTRSSAGTGLLAQVGRWLTVGGEGVRGCLGIVVGGGGGRGAKATRRARGDTLMGRAREGERGEYEEIPMR
jgi:hypothetical protein